MNSLVQILHILLQFLVALATLIVNFLVNVLQLLLQFIKAVAGNA